MIAGTGYIKSANDESLARDEGGGSNLFMEVVTYKTIRIHTGFSWKIPGFFCKKQNFSANL